MRSVRNRGYFHMPARAVRKQNTGQSQSCSPKFLFPCPHCPDGLPEPRPSRCQQRSQAQRGCPPGPRGQEVVQQEPVTLVLSGDRGISAFSESDLFKQVGTTTERANYGGLRCSSPRSSPVVLLQRTHAPPLPQCGHPG